VRSIFIFGTPVYTLGGLEYFHFFCASNLFYFVCLSLYSWGCGVIYFICMPQFILLRVWSIFIYFGAISLDSWMLGVNFNFITIYTHKILEYFFITVYTHKILEYVLNMAGSLYSCSFGVHLL
jgi:hypothetical protein